MNKTDLSVADVCLATGFESPASFIELFRRHLGVTPRKLSKIRKDSRLAGVIIGHEFQNPDRFFILSNSLAAGPLPDKGTETTRSVAHVEPGREAEYARLSAEAWARYHRLGFVLETPHIVLQDTDENGRPYSVEVFTWKSPDIPDHAPAAVKAMWQKLEDVCESRDGRRGIDFSEVTPLQLN